MNPADPRSEGANDPREALAEALAALASPVRLALLEELRTPKPLHEIRVSPSDALDPRGSPDRSIARQSVKKHLDKLVEVGVVVAEEGEGSRGPTLTYVVNHQVLFALSETFRRLALLRPVSPPSLETFDAPPDGAEDALRGPCLAMVKGLGEGRTFPLDPPPDAARREWVIGRRRGAEVPLDFDPYVSAENALVVWEDGTYRVQDLEDSRNGTTLNFRPLLRGGSRALRHGDLIGVGRCLLLFRA